jgi:hypothetical protein
VSSFADPGLGTSDPGLLRLLEPQFALAALERRFETKTAAQPLDSRAFHFG